MDGLSLLDPQGWRPELITKHPAYEIGNAAAWLSITGKQASVNQLLSGRLYVSKSGWLLLSVPNALVRGVFDALTAPGAELPRAGTMSLPDVKPELLNAHISVMTGDEVTQIGADKINERGHTFHYGLGPVKEITPKNHDTLSKVWAIQVASPALAALRKSYGLSPLPNGDHQFHITVAVRRKKVLQHNAVSKFDMATGRGELKAANFPARENNNKKLPFATQNVPCGKFSAAKLAQDLLHGGKADNMPDNSFSAAALLKGKKHEREHTDDDQIAKEIAKDHLQEDARYYEKVERIEKEGNAYVTQLQATPIHYDQHHSLWQNILHHATAVKARGDRQLDFQESAERFRREMDPQYRNAVFLQSVYNKQQPDRRPFKQRVSDGFEKLIHGYGHKTMEHALDHVAGFGQK